MNHIDKMVNESLENKINEIVENRVKEYIAENSEQIENIIIEQIQVALPKAIKKSVSKIVEKELGFEISWGELKINNEDSYKKVTDIFDEVLKNFKADFQEIAKQRVERVIKKSEVRIIVD